MSRAACAFESLNIALLTVSDSRTREQDRSGDYLSEQAQAAGHQVVARELLGANKYRLRALMSQWIVDESIHVIVINGGTGYTDQDVVPNAIEPLLDQVWLGFGELFRHLSFDDIGSSTLQSRAFGGFANGALILAIPGSPNACALAWEKLIGPQLDSRTRPCSVVPHLRGFGLLCER